MARSFFRDKARGDGGNERGWNHPSAGPRQHRRDRGGPDDTGDASSWSSQSLLLLCVQVRERAAALSKLPEKRRRFPEARVSALKRENPIEDFLQADGVRVPHWTAAITGESITCQIDRIDIGGTQRITFLQDARTFIDHDVQAPLDDFFICDGPLRNTCALSRLANEGFHFGVRVRFTVFIIAIPTR